VTLKHLWFEVTDQCNSRCSYCNIWKKKHTGKITQKLLSPNQLYLALTDPVFKNIKYVLNSGGEPTLKSSLLSYFEMEHKALPNATLQLSTNALLPNRVLEVAKAMFRQNCKIQVGISLDGIGDEHDRIRGAKGNFEKIEWLVPELKKYALVTLGATLTSATLKENLHAFEWAKSQGIPFMFHWLNKSSFYDNLDSNCENISVTSAVQMLPPSPYRDMWLSSLAGNPIRFKCKALQDFCVLKINGDIVPCLSLWSLAVGNIFENTPFSIFRSQYVKDAKRTIARCSGCLNNWGVCWSLTFIQKYWWWVKEKLKCG
jgi:MoaA/NifB/PqqE/SkfB family radical SAM enzyme